MSRISVVVPVYNTEAYIHRCVDSILNQTFSDFELILVDDGSPDNCPAICDEYAQRDSRVRVIHQENQGLAAVCNVGAKVAAGKWVCYIDSDDLVHPKLLELLISAADRSQCPIVTCRWQEGGAPSGDFFAPKAGEYRIHPTDEAGLVWLYQNGRNSYWCKCGGLYPRELILKHPFTPGKTREDNGVVFKWLYDTGKIACIQDELYFYYVNEAGITKSQWTPRQLDQLWALEEQVKFYRQVGYREVADLAAADLILHSTYHAQKMHDREVDRELIRRMLNTANTYLLQGGLPVLLKLKRKGYVFMHLTHFRIKIYSVWCYHIKNRLRLRR